LHPEVLNPCANRYSESDLKEAIEELEIRDRCLNEVLMRNIG